MTYAFVSNEDAQCIGKDAIGDEVEARRRAMSFRPPLKAYRCPHCRMWHIGSIGGSAKGKKPRARGRRR